VTKIVHHKDYQQARREAYPSLAEFVEALTERELGDPAKWRAYIEAVRAVRERFKVTPKARKK
jgi:hypothetical protein